MLRNASVRLLQTFQNKRKGKEHHATSRANSLAEPSSPTTIVDCETSSSSHGPRCNPMQEYSGPFPNDPLEHPGDSSELPARNLNRSASLPGQLPQNRRQPGGALRRLERRMSMESVANLNARRQQQEQRLQNHTIGSKEHLCKPSLPTQDRLGNDTKTEAVKMRPSLNKDVSLRDLVAEYEQTFL